MIRKLCLAITAFTMVFLVGCTGTRMNISPPPDGLTGTFPQKFNAVGVKEIPADKVYPPAGHPAQDFARELELSGISKTVYFPSRPDDKVDAVLETKVDVAMDPHMGSLMLKSFVTGLTLFILEPAFWYDFDYALVGRVDVVQEGKRTPIEAKTDASIGMKWLSLGQAQNLEIEAMKKSKQSLFRQVIEKLSKQ